MPTGCEVLFDREQAEAMQGLVEGALGRPCPCKEGNTCPLLPAAIRLPAPILRAAETAKEMVALTAFVFTMLLL